MKSKWIEHKNTKIFFQDFANHDLGESDAIREELAEVEKVVTAEAENSVLVLADFRNTTIGRDLMDILTDASKHTKGHIKKTAVLGITGTKRFLANILMGITGQQLVAFDDETKAKDWLVQK